MDKVEAAAAAEAEAEAEEEEEDVTWSVAGDEEDLEAELQPVEPLAEPSDDAGPIGWPMPDFCPLTIDGAVKESFLEMLRKDAEMLGEAGAGAGALQSPDSRPSSSKRQRAGTGSPSLSPSPSSRSPYRNILQVFQQCKQDVA